MRFSRFLQDYAVRLSKSKRSSKMNSPLIRSTDSVFTSSPVSIPEPGIAKSGPGGRISLLKKQLDEQRYNITSYLRDKIFLYLHLVSMHMCFNDSNTQCEKFSIFLSL